VDELTCVSTGHSKENDTFNEKIKELADSLSDSNNAARGWREQAEFVIGQKKFCCTMRPCTGASQGNEV
jgi:hypothetical protein